jgi:VWFA-related protein
MPKNLNNARVWRFRWILVLAACCPAARSSRAFAQSSDKTTVPSKVSQPPFQLKVGSNLVVMRVVVRDSDGKPVEGLQKEDFKVLDQGKEQSISQFEVETSAPLASTSATVRTPQPPAPAPPEMPTRFLAFYFDNLNTSDADMIYVREAADHYLAANLHAKDRVAIFTSDKMLSDFTADPQQIHAALSNLKASGQSMLRIHDCPDLTDYQALQITQQENPDYSDAWQMALDDARKRCAIQAPGGDAAEGPLSSVSKTSHAPEQASPADTMMASFIRSTARNIVFQAEIQARSNLQGLERVVNYIAQMPGQRTIVFVSPGFLSQSEQFPLDQVIDRALRSQVIISSLDPRGLALLLREADASREFVPGRPGTADRVDSQRELVAQDVLAEVAQETGGTFFHNNNDLQAGFGALAGSPVDYVLAFAPTDLKPDGKFHSLKVKLVEKHKSFSVQARRGYFAPRNEAEAAAEAKREAAFDAEAQAQAQIREAMFSKTVSQQLPVGLGGKLSDMQGGTRELSLISHLDAKPLHFQKDGEHNVNTVTFVFAIFDQQENLVTAQLRRTRLSVLDAQLQDLIKEGVSVNTRFQLKPGIYRIREVVTDSQEHHLTALSTTLKVP